MFCIIFYHTATTFKGPGFYPGHQLAHLHPSSSPKFLSSRRFRNEHATHNKDWKHSEQRRRKRSNGQCCSELMAISTQTSTIFALPVATWFESISTWPENILLIQDSGSMFQCLSIPSSFPSQEILLSWKQAEGDSCLPEWQWDFHPENAKYTNKQHVQGVNKDLKTQKNVYMTHYIWAGIRERDEFIINTVIAGKFLKATAVPTLITFS